MQPLPLSTHPLLRWLTPCRTAFLTSLALSWIAIQFEPILQRDAALYIETAQHFEFGNAASLRERFNWPWLSILIGVLSTLTFLPAITVGYGVISLFFAGTCAVLTRLTQRIEPRAGWWGCLVALSIPAFNGYRDGILREPGFWFFSSLAILLSLPSTRRRYRNLCLACLSILAAALFRLEAVFLFGAIFLAAFWQASSFWQAHKRHAIILVALTTLLLVIASLTAPLLAAQSERVAYYIQLLHPEQLAHALDARAQSVAEHVVAHHSRDDAHAIIIFGYFGVILFHAVRLLGPFAIPLLMRPWVGGPSASTHPASKLILVALLLYATVLFVFFVQNSFIVPRYISFLHVLGTPLLAIVCWGWAQGVGSKWKHCLIALSLMVAVGNVVSLSDKRTHYLVAAEWIERNLPEQQATYYQDPRVSFYAGRGFKGVWHEPDILQKRFDDYRYFVLERPESDPEIQSLIAAGHARVLMSFTNGETRFLTVLERITEQPPP